MYLQHLFFGLNRKSIRNWLSLFVIQRNKPIRSIIVPPRLDDLDFNGVVSCVCEVDWLPVKIIRNFVTDIVAIEQHVDVGDLTVLPVERKSFLKPLPGLVDVVVYKPNFLLVVQKIIRFELLHVQLAFCHADRVSAQQAFDNPAPLILLR